MFRTVTPATTVELVEKLSTRIYLPLEFVVMIGEKGRSADQPIHHSWLNHILYT